MASRSTRRGARIGLRTLRLERKPDAWGESFQFVVNGVPFFAKGANWIPADAFVTRIGPADYDDLIQAAVDANMNMLRVWGGGIYEDDAFYDLCDELGICVWQDFMFACSAYPAFDGEFMDNVQGGGRGQRAAAAPPRLPRALVRQQRDRADRGWSGPTRRPAR